jgi:predicted peptidase
MTRKWFFTSFSVLAFAAFPINLGAADAAQQRVQVFESQATRSFRLPYLLFLPAEYEKNISQRWPLILYLHGGSLRGADIDSLRKLGLPHKVESEPNFPFVVVSPQCPAGEIWTDVETLDALLDHLQTAYRIDADRITVTGHSMGGRGALYLAYRFPQRFAAVLALSPLSPVSAWAQKLAKLPLWILHGETDSVAPVADTKDLARSIQAAGGHPRMEILPARDHFILDVYDRADIYKWLVQQKRGAQPTQVEKQ